MHKRKLGSQGLEVSALGLGCMGMSWAYGSANEQESLSVIHRALELGINFLDTAEVYGPFTNEELLSQALKNIPREKIIIASKFAWEFSPEGKQLKLNSSPDHIKKSIDGTLKRLNTDYVDLYYQHRLDPNTPIEETIGALTDLINAGKIKYIGLSEVGPSIIRRAHAVHPISAVQCEYSLWERNVEDKILPTMRELGIGFVAYSPIGRGFLSGKIKSVDDFEATDWRRTNPRFQADNFKHNMEIVEIVKKIADANHATPAQIALAWLLRKGEDIVPIPGTKHLEFLNENAKAATIKLPEASWSDLDKKLAGFVPAGERYTQEAMKTIDRSE